MNTIKIVHVFLSDIRSMLRTAHLYGVKVTGCDIEEWNLIYSGEKTFLSLHQLWGLMGLPSMAQGLVHRS